MEILLKFQGDFWKNLRRITKTSNNFIEKLQRKLKEVLKIFGALSRICPGCFKALSGTENTANIFQNNILLVSPLTTYSVKIFDIPITTLLMRIHESAITAWPLSTLNAPQKRYFSQAKASHILIMSIQHILTKELGMRCVSSMWVPYFLRAEEMEEGIF